MFVSIGDVRIAKNDFRHLCEKAAERGYPHVPRPGAWEGVPEMLEGLISLHGISERHDQEEPPRDRNGGYCIRFMLRSHFMADIDLQDFDDWTRKVDGQVEAA